MVTRAEGSYVWDRKGNRLLDFTSQLVFTSLGHQHPKIVEAARQQATTLCMVAPAYVNGARPDAGRLIASHTPGDLNRVFFTNGGADANEHAARMATYTLASTRCSLHLSLLVPPLTVSSDEAHRGIETLDRALTEATSAGRKDLRWHDLRHTGAVLAAQTGATLTELMGRLGHSTPGAAMRRHALPARRR